MCSGVSDHKKSEPRREIMKKSRQIIKEVREPALRESKEIERGGLVSHG